MLNPNKTINIFCPSVINSNKTAAMTNFGTLESIALTFPEVTIEPHFEKLSFRIKKKIFATYDEKHNKATVKLSESDQYNFSLRSQSIYPVDNNWGKQGWTQIELDKIEQELLLTILKTAYFEVAPKRLSKEANRIEE